MPTAQQRTERAQRARANGAKSRGPKTAAGLHRARTASIRSGLYTTSVSGICPESNEAFLPFHAKLLAFWNPQSTQAELLVNQLITVLWDIRLLQNGYSIYMSQLVEILAVASPYANDPVKLTLEAQKLALGIHGGTVARFQARLGACFRTRARIERQLYRLEKQPATSAPSQKLLKINSQPYTALVHPETAQHHPAPAAHGWDEVAGTGRQNEHPTSAPSQKSLKTKDRPRHNHPAHRE